ncbi:spore germination protein [Clostridium formicaceticum]|uniref:Spore germination protein n=1 Tax=Clostridium formicaceticum TaxID=1497 RepID=A0AAC9RG29_9CLOT|nr:spore germination protein [Clostridium formicaceticum]AOY75846.1 spore germination protein [Clostridium formicaceticum]ARE86181.1 Spore germination protein B1 [Clostridium formicaceticum]
MEDKNNESSLSKNFSENINYLLKELRIEKNFDVVHRKLEYGNKKFGLFFIDGFANAEVMLEIMKELKKISPNALYKDAIQKLVQQFIPHIEVETSKDLEEVISQVLSGQAAFIVEGYDEAILVDIREYPARSPEEPDIERVVRGPRDGFVETIVFNAALIRRKIRDRSLVMEHFTVGRRSKTDVIVAYLDSVADKHLVEEIAEKINDIRIDGLPMEEKSLEEFIFGRHYNPYPMVRYTERADTCGVHLKEGHILILVDGSPSVMICPTTFWHHLQHAEEYRQKPIVGIFLRWVRFVAILASLFLLPLWYVLAENPQLLPESIKFIGPEKTGNIPLFWQFFLAEIGIEILRMAAIHTPNALATALGLVAAILIGEVAINVGLFAEEVILYLAIAAMSTFATPSYELSLANRIFRLVFLIVGAVLGIYGLIGAVILWFILLATTKSLNVPYLWPLVPLNIRALIDFLFRIPVPLKKQRPSILNTQDDTKS